ncbi:hypothetical protein V6V47_13830 [Micromonospora sp. CPCC 205539]|uniref:hypothetical protein n=1 Tax=Micromonospora sp. CPCC 205539 TaxID=3122408 RepID=UPI002FF3B21D
MSRARRGPNGPSGAQGPDRQVIVFHRGRDAGLRADHEGSELIEGEHPLREVGADVLDAGEFGIALRVGGLLPRLGPLKGDPVLVQGLPQPFPPTTIRRAA